MNNIELLRTFHVPARSYDEIKEEIKVLNTQMRRYSQDELPTVHAAQMIAQNAIANLQAAYIFFQQQPLLDPGSLETLRRYGFNSEKIMKKEQKRLEKTAELFNNIRELLTWHQSITARLSEFSELFQRSSLIQRNLEQQIMFGITS